MSMTRDAYAKEVLRVAEAALFRNETAACPHEDCAESIAVVYSTVMKTRAVVCPVHGAIFYEQRTNPYEELDWEAAERRAAGRDLFGISDDWDEDQEVEDESEDVDDLDD